MHLGQKAPDAFYKYSGVVLAHTLYTSALLMSVPAHTSDRDNSWCHVQDLVGRLPDFTKESAAKLVELRMSNTSLQQCDATHLAVHKPGLQSTVIGAGSSDTIAADNVTECLPQFLVFCDKDEEEDSPLYCPSVSFRRPAQEPLIHVDRV